MGIWSTLGAVGGGLVGGLVGQPVLGAAIGGKIGGLGDRSRSSGSQRSTSRSGRRDIRGDLVRQLTGEAGQSVQGSQTYRQGVSVINTQADQAASNDAATAFSRGVDGTAVEVAQGESRRRVYAQQLLEVLDRAERDRLRKMQLAAGIEGDREALQLSRDRLSLENRIRKDNNRNFLLGQLGELVGSGLTAVGSFGSASSD